MRSWSNCPFPFAPHWPLESCCETHFGFQVNSAFSNLKEFGSANSLSSHSWRSVIGQASRPFFTALPKVNVCGRLTPGCSTSRTRSRRCLVRTSSTSCTDSQRSTSNCPETAGCNASSDNQENRSTSCDRAAPESHPGKSGELAIGQGSCLDCREGTFGWNRHHQQHEGQRDCCQFFHLYHLLLCFLVKDRIFHLASRKILP